MNNRTMAALVLAALAGLGNLACSASPTVKLVRATHAGDVVAVRQMMAEARRLQTDQKVDVNQTVNYESQAYSSAFGAAVGTQILELVQLMIDANADVNAVGYWDGDRTALSMLMMGNARYWGATEVEKQIPEGTTHAEYHSDAAIQGRLFAIANVLLAAGADPNAADNDGNTPLHLLLLDEKRCEVIPNEMIGQMVFELWTKGAKVDSANSKGDTPIFLAVKCAHIDPVKWLVRAGANLESRNAAGDTPLLAAVRLRATHPLQALLAGGADTHALSAKKESVCDIAEAGSPVNRRDWVLEVLTSARLPCAVALTEKRDAALAVEAVQRMRRGNAKPDPESWLEDLARKKAEEAAQAEQARIAAAKEAEDLRNWRPSNSGRQASVRCPTSATACGQYCCGTGTMCCAAEDRSDTVGGFCMAMRTGHGCPWGTREAR